MTGTGETSMPTVSVVVPVFNGAGTIRACLESILQLVPPTGGFEVLCIDNGSTDSTVELVRSVAPTVQLLHESTRGAAAARNCGIRASRATIVAFTDADCEVDRHWLERLIVPLDDPTVGIVGGRILARPPANYVERFGEVIHDHRRAIEVLRPPYAITMSWASRREVLLACGLFDERLLRGQDAELAWRIGRHGYRLHYVDEATVYHRNERTLRGLFGEGYTHGYHAPQVRALHADALPGLDRRSQMRRALLRAWISQSRPEADWRERLCSRVFNAGKAVGEIRALVGLRLER